MSNTRLITTALRMTDPELYRKIDGGNSWYSAIEAKALRSKKYRDYVRGNHDADLTDEMRALLRLPDRENADLKEFTDNYMKIVVDKMASRVAVDEVTADETAHEQWLNTVDEVNNIRKLETSLYRSAIRDGDSYIFVSPKGLRFVSEPEYDGSNGIVMIYDPLTQKPIWACKVWGGGQVEDEEDQGQPVYVNVYQAHRFWYFEGRKGEEGLSMRAEPSDWLVGEIPLVKFVNQGDNYTFFGESEIRPAMPLQDALNRTLYSMVMASELSAFKIFYSIGAYIDKSGIVPGAMISVVLKDESGNVINELTSEQVEYLKSIRIGELGATDMSQYIAEMDKIVREISQVTQTPIYGITAQGNLSGEALKQLEVGLLDKVYRFQRENEDAWKQAYKLTALIQQKYETGIQGNAPDDFTINIRWKSPEITENTSQIATLSNLRKDNPGLYSDDLYRKKIGQLMGFSKDELEKDAQELANQSLFQFQNTQGEITV